MPNLLSSCRIRELITLVPVHGSTLHRVLFWYPKHFQALVSKQLLILCDESSVGRTTEPQACFQDTAMYVDPAKVCHLVHRSSKPGCATSVLPQAGTSQTTAYSTCPMSQRNSLAQKELKSSCCVLQGGVLTTAAYFSFLFLLNRL